MNIGARYATKLCLADTALIAYSLLAGAIALALRQHAYFLFDMLSVCAILYLAAHWTISDAHGQPAWWNLRRLVREYYGIPLLISFYDQTDTLTKRLGGPDCDELLLRADGMLIHGDIASLLSPLASPLLTEYLQLCYAGFYAVLAIPAVDLYLQRNLRGFRFLGGCVMAVTCLTFVGYYLLPAVGPRFARFDYFRMNAELPGLYFTDKLREMVDASESIITGAPNPRELARRDCFPSGHTSLTLVVIYSALRFRARSRWLVLVLGLSIVFATLYMRYHYLVDVIAAAVLAVLVLLCAHALPSLKTAVSKP